MERYPPNGGKFNSRTIFPFLRTAYRKNHGRAETVLGNIQAFSIEKHPAADGRDRLACDGRPDGHSLLGLAQGGTVPGRHGRLSARVYRRPAGSSFRFSAPGRQEPAPDSGPRREKVLFFLHSLEELSPGHGHGRNRLSPPALPFPETLACRPVHHHWNGSHPFQPAIFSHVSESPSRREVPPRRLIQAVFRGLPQNRRLSALPSALISARSLSDPS
jgi:hypothetical protein